MEITEVKIKLHRNLRPGDRLLAYVTVVFDNFLAVHGLKVINANKRVCVCMPSRPATDHCPDCDTVNSLAAKYCGTCARELPADPNGPGACHYDVVHPINQRARDLIETAVLNAYDEERLNSIREAT